MNWLSAKTRRIFFLSCKTKKKKDEEQEKKKEKD